MTRTYESLPPLKNANAKCIIPYSRHHDTYKVYAKYALYCKQYAVCINGYCGPSFLFWLVPITIYNKGEAFSHI